MPARRGAIPAWVNNAGEYRNQAVIEQASDVRRASGSFDRNWATFAVVKCRIDATGGKEAYGAATVSSQSEYKIEMHWLSGVTSAMRINLNGRLMDILNIQDVNERHRKLVLICREGRGQGI